MTDHRCFTVSATAYLRNLDRSARNGKNIAVHYQDRPTKTERGTSYGMRWPLLIVANYIDNAEEVAQRVADILEKHWHDPVPEAPLPDSQLEHGGACS